MSLPTGPTAWPLAYEQGLAVNGRDLSELATIADSLAGLLSVPKKRGDNITVPGRHGAIHTRKMYDQRETTLPLLVRGAKPDGSMPLGGSAREELYARADELCKVFAADEVTIDHTLPDGSTRRLVGEVLGAVDFTRRLGTAPLIAAVKVALRCANPFWTDLTDTTATFALANGGKRLLTEFAAATAPLDELRVTFVGPISNPQIADLGTGAYLAYDQVLTAGQKLVVDCGAWSLSSGDGTPFTPAWRSLRHAGVPGRWWEVAPADPAAQLQLGHTGGGTATVQIAGRRKYLIG